MPIDLPALDVGYHGPIAIVTFNLQDMRSALMRALQATVDRLTNDDQVRAIIFTGRRNMFLSGAHLPEFQRMDTPQAAAAGLRPLRPFVRRLTQTPKVTIAAINGFCIGGGLELALACDRRICVDTVENAGGEAVAFLGFPEVALGVIPPLGGTYQLPRIVGLARAKHMMLTGDLIGGVEAHQIGLVDELAAADQVLDSALAWAERVTANAGPALAAVKDLLNRSLDFDNLTNALDAAGQAFAACSATPEKQSRLDAARGRRRKRQPTPSAHR